MNYQTTNNTISQSFGPLKMVLSAGIFMGFFFGSPIFAFGIINLIQDLMKDLQPISATVLDTTKNFSCSTSSTNAQTTRKCSDDFYVKYNIILLVKLPRK